MEREIKSRCDTWKESVCSCFRHSKIIGVKVVSTAEHVNFLRRNFQLAILCRFLYVVACPFLCFLASFLSRICLASIKSNIYAKCTRKRNQLNVMPCQQQRMSSKEKITERRQNRMQTSTQAFLTFHRFVRTKQYCTISEMVSLCRMQNSQTPSTSTFQLRKCEISPLLLGQ